MHVQVRSSPESWLSTACVDLLRSVYSHASNLDGFIANAASHTALRVRNTLAFVVPKCSVT